MVTNSARKPKPHELFLNREIQLLAFNRRVLAQAEDRKIPTLDYFEQILLSSNEETIFIFDDIHWSKEMEEAWEIIKQHTAVSLSIDLFFIGIVFLKKDFKVKQHFVIRF